MRSLIFWASGMVLAFFVTAGAFLLLAELGSDLSSRNLSSNTQHGDRDPSLVLSIGEEQLDKLERKPDQPLTIGLRNQDGKRLEDISITLEVAPEDTSSPQIRFYRTTVKKLPAGDYATVDFALDLSFPESSERSLSIIEVRAVTPGGLSAVRTAILPS